MGDHDGLESVITIGWNAHPGQNSVDGELRQSVLDQPQIALREEDLTNATAVPEKMQTIIDAEASAPFDLAVPPLVRFTVVRQPASRDVLIIVMHHIVGDGWSRGLLHRELSVLYDAVRHGRSSPLAPLRIQYKDSGIRRASLSGRSIIGWRISPVRRRASR
ncbi:condensation domain-containing protein (plasmid) [Bradyrhizobium sp. Pa8]|uniref:condensation domain-containing protein n=1 Tax=Bradyrhizobium sp. Pa8 TaxID=3386552 RepID=UPI00403F7261